MTTTKTLDLRGPPDITPEPTRFSYTHQQMLDAAKQWMRDNYGVARELPEASRDRYHEKLGLLVDFIGTVFSSNPPGGPWTI